MRKAPPMSRVPCLVSRVFRGAAVALLIAAAAGCSGGSSVDGTVTLDGQPLKEGTVRFVPVDPNAGGTVGAPVKDGKFTAEVPHGEYRVEFSSPKVVGKRKAYDTPDSPVVDIVDELIPARFNTTSDLRVTVKKGGQKETFALTSK
jgi:hypothetical protein